ncbi:MULTISPECIES: hypothetical protein [unclassified Acinetobacter]|uniref:hypothetical protein n=1 Tax=unclassified Acinetobacter TaxID=196816 RepID=UPI0035B7C970
MPIDSLKSTWRFHRRSNQKVLDNLALLQSIAYSARDKQEILDRLHPWRGATQALKFYNQFSYIMILLVAISIVFVTLYLAHYGILLIITWLLGGAAILYAYFSLESKQDIQKTIELLVEKVYQLQYDIRFHQFPDLDSNVVMNQQYMLTLVKNRFPNLNEGTYGNEVSTIAATTWQVDGHDYPVLLFKYIKRDRRIGAKNENGQEAYIERILYGACIFDMPALAFVVANQRKDYVRYPVPWQSSDVQFNDRFKVYGQTEMELAKNVSGQGLLCLAQNLTHMDGSLIFHEEMSAFCYLSKQNIFHCTAPAKPIQSISELRGALRTLHAPFYEQMQQSLTAIIRGFSDADLLKSKRR